MIFINPTGKGIRSDGFGDGNYKARRRRSDGSRYKHKGIDYICKVGQSVYAPADAVYKRIAYPYANSREYSGMHFEAEGYNYKLFYVTPSTKPGTKVVQGQIIGIAQNVGDRYGVDFRGKKMVPHVHFEITSISPEILIGSV